MGFISPYPVSHNKPSILCLVFLFFILILGVPPHAEGEENPSSLGNTQNELNLFWTHLYWKDGLHIDGKYKNFKFRIGGIIMLDMGNLNAGSKINHTFPHFEDKNGNLRKLILELNGVLFDTVETKFQIDFANINEIKDNWFRFLNVPILKRFKFGHMKEPFSLEALTSGSDLTFMERALPVMAFSSSRNIGIRYDDLGREGELTWAVGAFLNTGSFSNIGTASDQIKQRSGWDITGRITYHINIEKKERDFFHFGVSYTHRFLDRGKDENEIKFSSLPESYLTNTRLLDTGKFSLKHLDAIDGEFAYVSGPFSIQSEIFNVFLNSETKGRPHFWGGYVYGSYFLTGETRPYDKTHGIFSNVKPIHPFRPFVGQWGAFEVALRVSYADLNGSGIRGGRERNLSAGLNWYLFPQTRVMFNYIYADLLESDAPRVRNGHADILMLRLQFGF